MQHRYQVGPDTVVTLEFAAFDADGDPIATGESRLELVFGRGQLLPAVERAIEGLSAGDRKTIVLRPEEAFGRRKRDAVLEVDRGDFPEDVAPGDRFEMENEAGALLVLRVLDVGPDVVYLDLNHPLAGQEIRFDLAILGVRPATSEELEAADRAIEAALESVDADRGTPVAMAPIPLERLLRGRGRGYERDPTGASPAAPLNKPGGINEH